jgi:hypothetical protein
MPQEGLSYYEIVNNPELLKKMTCEAGQELTHSEQVAKLEQMMNRKKRAGKNPPDILS